MRLIREAGYTLCSFNNLISSQHAKLKNTNPVNLGTTEFAVCLQASEIRESTSMRKNKMSKERVIHLPCYSRARNRQARNRRWAWTEPLPLTPPVFPLYLESTLSFRCVLPSLVAANCLFGSSTSVALNNTPFHVFLNLSCNATIVLEPRPKISARFCHSGYLLAGLAENRSV